MTLDLGPIKERAENANLLSGVDPSDALALVAEVEALRAALGAERELADEARAFVHRATLRQYGVSDPRCNRETAEAWLDRRLDLRRATNIGGGE